MTPEQVEQQVIELIYREPFVPFVVNLRDGRQIVIKQLPVVFADGAASFIDFENEALVEFFHNEVKTFAVLEQETPA